MAPASNEEQFKFLISCIRYSNNGRVDFGQVASECNIVSKGAASKRYERLMRTHGIASYTATGKPARAPRLGGQPDTTNPKKKRKTEALLDDSIALDDEEDFPLATIKSDPEDREGYFRIKSEDSRDFMEDCKQLSIQDATNLMRYYDRSSLAAVDTYGVKEEEEEVEEKPFARDRYEESANSCPSAAGSATSMGGLYGLEQHDYGCGHKDASMASLQRSPERAIKSESCMSSLESGDGTAGSALVID